MPMRALQPGFAPETINKIGKWRDCGAGGPVCGPFRAADDGGGTAGFVCARTHGEASINASAAAKAMRLAGSLRTSGNTIQVFANRAVCTEAIIPPHGREANGQ